MARSMVRADVRATRAQRVGVAIVVAAAAGASWVALSQLAMGSAMMGSGGMSLDAVAFLVTWSLMVGGMMLPTIAPMVVAFLTLGRALPRRARAGQVTAFVVPYLAVWLVAGGAALALRLASTGQPLLTAACIAAAGLYQLGALKQEYLRACRNPVGFFLQYGDDLGSLRGSVRLGLRHAALCFGCCVGLMVALMGAASIELTWMAALGLLMMLEKTHPFGPRLAWISGWVLLVLAPLSLVIPTMGSLAIASGATTFVALLALLVLSIARPRNASPALAV